MISCWLDAKVKLVVKSFNGECTTSGDWSEWEQGHSRMTGVDVSQLQDGIFMMDQKGYMDNIDAAEIKPERWKTPEASVTERENPGCEDSGERCNRRTQREHAPCQCYDLCCQWQQLAR